MSEGKKCRVHTPEFKAKVGSEAARGVNNWLRVFVFENTRAHSDANPRVISGGHMRGKATDTHGAW